MGRSSSATTFRRPRTCTTSRPTAGPMRRARASTEPTDARIRHRARRVGRRRHPAWRRLPHRRSHAEPGHHDPALCRRAADPQGHARRDGVGGAAQQRLADEVDHPLSRRRPLGLVAPRARRHAHAAAPVQQRHGVRGRSTCSESVGWEGELDDGSFYIDYETGHVYIGSDPKDRLVEITAFDVRTAAHVAAGTRQEPTTARVR